MRTGRLVQHFPFDSLSFLLNSVLNSMEEMYVPFASSPFEPDDGQRERERLVPNLTHSLSFSNSQWFFSFSFCHAQHKYSIFIPYGSSYTTSGRERERERLQADEQVWVENIDRFYSFTLFTSLYSLSRTFM